MDLKTLFLKENVGGWDLLLRAFVGSLAITLLAMGAVPSPWEWLAGLTAFLGIYTALLRHCSPYSLIGFSTAK